MNTRGVRLAQLFAASLALLALRGEAAAYCRTRTCEFRSNVACPTDDLTGCSETGAFVYWKSGCVPYAVQRDGSADEDISAAQVAELLDEGFRVWSELDCARGGSPELATSRQGLLACDAVEYDCMAGSRNSNLVVFRDDFMNSDFGLRFGVIALTTVTANLISGEIFDADIEINSRDEDFSLDAVVPGGGPRDLRGVINHELGHLLGLSHSSERGALMRALYEGTAAPSADDAAGMCAALGAANGDPACTAEALDPDGACLGSNTACTSIATEEEDPGGSCACRTARPQPGGQGVAAWVIGTALWVARRRGSSRQRVL